MSKNVPSAGELLNHIVIPIVGEGMALTKSEEGLGVLMGHQDSWPSGKSITQRE